MKTICSNCGKIHDRSKYESRYKNYFCSIRCHFIFERKMTIVNFWNGIKKTRKCWYWRGYIDKLGYGRISAKKVHRMSYEIHKGRIPKGINVLHSCDIRHCVNPKHLWLGTQLDNVRDMLKKGRRANSTGENHPRAVLTDKAVRYIRSLPKKRGLVIHLSKKFNVSKSAINSARSGKNWSHIS